MNYIGAGLGLLGGASSLFGEDPAEAAAPYLGGIGRETKPYYDPYIQAGREAIGQVQPEYQRLIQDPSGALARIGAGYQASPGYQFTLGQAQKAAQQAAAAGGMLGTPAQQQRMSEITSNLASQDYNNYLRNVMGLYGQGLSGLSGIGQMGYGASDAMARMLAQQMASQAQLQYAGAANRNQGIGGILGDIGGILGSIF